MLILRRHALLLLGTPLAAPAQEASPHAIDIPRWFSDSFLDLKEDVAEAARAGKRLMLYFGQDGCPYCRELMSTNFSQRSIVDKTRAHFVALALNLWGDREVTWLDGQVRTEKQLAQHLKVQFTPTLLFFDTDGRVAQRLNGYQPPERFEAVLDHVIQRRPEPLADWLAKAVKPGGRPEFKAQPWLMAPGAGGLLDLARQAGSRPLALLVESRRCAACDEMHDQALARPPMQALLKRLDVARLGLGDSRPITTPAGQRADAAAWLRELKLEFTPSVLFFDERGREVFRVDGYTRPFHYESAFDYVASGAWRSEPQFQRFIQARAERRRAAGQPVDIWR